MGAAEGFVGVLRALQKAFIAIDAPFMVIGGVAVIAHGVPRATVDVDGLVWEPISTSSS